MTRALRGHLHAEPATAGVFRDCRIEATCRAPSATTDVPVPTRVTARTDPSGAFSLELPDTLPDEAVQLAAYAPPGPASASRA